MNPVWEHWEQLSIGGKGDKVDAYMCVRLQPSPPLLTSLYSLAHYRPLTQVLQVLP